MKNSKQYQDVTREFAQLYADAPNTDVDYHPLINVISRQFVLMSKPHHDVLTRFSLTDAYSGNIQAMFADINCGTLFVWQGERPTDTGLSNPVSSELTNLCRFTDIPVIYNEIFRATHDYFGHYRHNLSLSRDDEFRAAWLYGQINGLTDDDAFLSETVCQNAYYWHFGEFSKQKSVRVPKQLKTLWRITNEQR